MSTLSGAPGASADDEPSGVYFSPHQLLSTVKGDALPAGRYIVHTAPIKGPKDFAECPKTGEICEFGIVDSTRDPERLHVLGLSMGDGRGEYVEKTLPYSSRSGISEELQAEINQGTVLPEFPTSSMPFECEAIRTMAEEPVSDNFAQEILVLIEAAHADSNLKRRCEGCRAACFAWVTELLRRETQD